MYLLSESKGKKDQEKHSQYPQVQFSYPMGTWKKRTTDFLSDERGEYDEYLDVYEKEYKATYGRIYTDKT